MADARFRQLRTHPWWVVLGSVTVAVAVVGWLLWQPLWRLAGPSWSVAAWHVDEFHGDRISLLVEQNLCHPDDEPRPVRVRADERDDLVLVRASHRGDGRLPVPRACTQTIVLSRAEVALDAPLGDRALYGCNLAEHRHPELEVGQGDDCGEMLGLSP